MSEQVSRLRAVGHDDGWAVRGGMVEVGEVGESPSQAAVREAREAREEIGTGIRLVRPLDVLGGRDDEVTYPPVPPSPAGPLYG